MHRYSGNRLLVAVALTIVSLVALRAQTAGNAHRIAVFGSSVANGTGDWLGHEGYTGRLRALLAPRGWDVLNQSRGGDNTVKMAPRFTPIGPPQPNTRYLLPVDPHYVLLGLSLGNEGIANVATKAEKDAVYAQFESGMKGYIAKSREHGIVPIVTSCYTRNDFTEVEYQYTRRMNLAMNGWGVPSVNFLGAVDDGTGKWAPGFWYDSLHPNPSGHDELLTTFVPSLFEALEKGKPLPTRSSAAGFAHTTRGHAAIQFIPTDTMHPFALALTVRAQANGMVADIEGVGLDAHTTKHTIERANGPSTQVDFTTLSAGQPFAATIGVAGGVWTYTSSSGATIVSSVKADGSWHQIVLSHYTARGETLLFVDGQLAGRTPERLETRRFLLGGAPQAEKAPAQIDLKDLLIYRSALNADEVAALHSGTLLQSSLEVYAPLADTTLSVGTALENRAQSTTAATVIDGNAMHSAPLSR